LAGTVGPKLFVTGEAVILRSIETKMMSNRTEQDAAGRSARTYLDAGRAAAGVAAADALTDALAAAARPAEAAIAADDEPAATEATAEGVDTVAEELVISMELEEVTDIGCTPVDDDVASLGAMYSGSSGLPCFKRSTARFKTSVWDANLGAAALDAQSGFGQLGRPQPTVNCLT